MENSERWDCSTAVFRCEANEVDFGPVIGNMLQTGRGQVFG